MENYPNPTTAALQSFRVNITPPFTITGVDFTGALYVKSPTNNRESKAYDCLFTCAVHLELVPDLTTRTFLNAFRRFAARRSLPTTMVSDNASTNLSAADELRILFDSPEIKTYLTNTRATWKFIPKRTPWFGGFWERLIGITKNAIKKVLGRSYITFDELRTLLTEVENVLNDRPLTYVSSDLEDNAPLSPSHLLHGRPLTSLPHIPADEDELVDPTFGNHNDLNKRYAYLPRLHARFWRRWASEYLTALRENQKISGKTENVIKVGDVVLVHHDTDKHVNWKLATVLKLNRGNDGIIRSAHIRTANGLTSRPVTKLYPLEVNVNITPTEVLNNDTHMDVTHKQRGTTLQRSTRNAAAIARCKIQDLNRFLCLTYFGIPYDILYLTLRHYNL
ncbi:uncharacterized protein LOC144362083 [Saccoglossus kowalevskii]